MMRKTIYTSISKHAHFAVWCVGIIGTIAFYYAAPLITVSVLTSTIRQSTPLILGALCGLMGERSGIINIGIEGQMLSAAFIGFLAYVWTHNPYLAICISVLAGAVMGLLLSFMSISLHIDQIISGTIVNMLSLGVTGYFYQPGLTTQGKLQAIPVYLFKDIPLIGPVVFNNPPITYGTVIIVFLIHYLLFHTRWGLRTRAVGEHPRAADTMGVNVRFMRHTNLAIGGSMAGLAGAFLTLEAVGSFERGMTNGRGFVALAIMIFGKWTPLGAWGGSLLFGFANALQTQFQFAGYLKIPHQFIGMLPYVLTLAILALFMGNVRPPAALGISYGKE